MSQQLLDRYSPAEAHVAARLVEGSDARREAAELLRESVGNGAAGEPRHRRARWLKALADALAPDAPFSFASELRDALEAVRDEAPGEGTVLDAARERALRLLEAEEELDAATAAARAGESERCESALSFAFAEAAVFGPREEARRCVRAAEALVLAREDARADRLLQVARERYAGAGAVEPALAVGLRLGDRAWRRGEIPAALSAFDEVRAGARLAERPALELAALRRLMALAALRSDPRAVHRLYDEIASRLAALPAEEARERAVAHWVAHCVLRRTGDRTRSVRALAGALEAAEAARDMPLAWLAAAQLGEPLPSELVRRLQKPPLEARDLYEAVLATPDADPDLHRGLLEGALRLLESMGPDADLRQACEKALAALPRAAA